MKGVPENLAKDTICVHGIEKRTMSFIICKWCGTLQQCQKIPFNISEILIDIKTTHTFC
jgi:hypothetical protein